PADSPDFCGALKGRNCLSADIVKLLRIDIDARRNGPLQSAKLNLSFLRGESLEQGACAVAIGCPPRKRKGVRRKDEGSFAARKGHHPKILASFEVVPRWTFQVALRPITHGRHQSLSVA